MHVFPQIIPFLAGGTLVSAFLIAGRTRLMSLITLFRAQSLFLVLYTMTLGYLLSDPALYVAALLTLVVKVFLVPSFFSRAARKPGVSERLESYLRPATRSFIAIALIMGSFYVAHTYPFPNTDYMIVAASFALIMVGFAMLITRKDMFGQGTGFLTFENGIFTFGLALTHGMPLLVEIGILFDVLIGFVLMVALLQRAQKEYHSVTTDHLHELIG